MLLRLAVLALVAPILAETGRVLFGRNLHAVAPGLVYRCSQRTGKDLMRLLTRYKIKTIVNLRGNCDIMDWYQEECRTAHEAGVNLEDISMSAGRLPSISEMRRFVEILDHAEYPLVFHCRRGSDRTGLASVIYRLLHSNDSLAQARSQLGLRYGHLAVGRPASLDRFFAFYEDWLRRQQATHTPERFRDWILHHYRPGECYCEVQPVPLRTTLQRNERASLTFRFWNRSGEAWHFRPGSRAGDHAWLTLADAEGTIQIVERAGLFERFVAPGESIDLTVHLPQLVKPGRYRMVVDLCNEQQSSFYQVGSEPWEQEIEVH